MNQIMFFTNLFNKEKCKHNTYKLEADFSADPIWCNDCGKNLDLEEFPLSENLKGELEEWINDCGNWIDFDTDSLRGNGIEMETEYNKKRSTALWTSKKTIRYRLSDCFCSF
ncbi:hypothetical protein Q8G31_29310 [Priestia megaterium]|uniref:hypothetical protein n=1 Tax=Priestia megaterium TaxID=1404 RepID=UPI0023DB0931|nr:hypothetical protein [Priestia megaterium]MDF2053279.1 hypothetical protein [Priestia megaterium]MDF2062677.1 hypothetical protein [Priestia megaterium]MDP1383764.1 hypothetical protein [Priestia megaterium]MDP1427930.1 hypothetical protein [Priestia megaterium]